MFSAFGPPCNCRPPFGLRGGLRSLCRRSPCRFRGTLPSLYRWSSFGLRGTLPPLCRWSSFGHRGGLRPLAVGRPSGFGEAYVLLPSVFLRASEGLTSSCRRSSFGHRSGLRPLAVGRPSGRQPFSRPLVVCRGEGMAFHPPLALRRQTLRAWVALRTKFGRKVSANILNHRRTLYVIQHRKVFILHLLADSIKSSSISTVRPCPRKGVWTVAGRTVRPFRGAGSTLVAYCPKTVQRARLIRPTPCGFNVQVLRLIRPTPRGFNVQVVRLFVPRLVALTSKSQGFSPHASWF